MLDVPNDMILYVRDRHTVIAKIVPNVPNIIRRHRPAMSEPASS
jgi:hypothetical protein